MPDTLPSESWNDFLLGMARYISRKSKDPSTKVGAVIVDADMRPVSWGYNGFPRGIADDHRLADRETKYKLVMHAERNALLFAHRNMAGCFLYTFPFPPCSQCAAMAIQAGIRGIFFPADWKTLDLAGRWTEDCALAEKMFHEAGVHYTGLWTPRGPAPLDN